MDLRIRADSYIEFLCNTISERTVGSAGNQKATSFFSERMSSFGFSTQNQSFNCFDWRQSGAELRVAGTKTPVRPSPYTIACSVKAPVAEVTTYAELEKIDVSERLLYLSGEIAKEQLMPKNFPFYNPEEHQKIVALLEAKRPKAIVAATTQNPDLAGGVYPFPLIEDGDFLIPSIYMTADEGRDFLKLAGQKPVELQITAERVPTTGNNVIAKKGEAFESKIVICAHIDSKMGTPGAIDNASGVAALLLLGELAEDYTGKIGLEIVAINGEDYYSSPGEIAYLDRIRAEADSTILGINIDAAGYVRGATSFSLYECPKEISQIANDVFLLQRGFVAGEPWYQSDHSLFIQNGVPACALTSELAVELFTHITHTEKDSPQIIDCKRVADVAEAIHELILRVGGLHDR